MKEGAPEGITINSCKSTLLSACSPPLIIFIIGTGSLNPETPLEAINGILDQVDIVLLMSVNPGFGGQSFIPSSIDKIKKLHSYIEEKKLNTLLEVDGGVNIENAKEIRESGADVLVAGTAIFRSENYTKTISLLRG